MTVEEAIQHCKEQAATLRMAGDSGCAECAAEHEQLAEWLTELKQRREAEITAPPKSNDEHTAAYWMQKTMDAAHEAYDRLKDTVDFKNAIAEAEAIKQRMGIGEKKKISNADRIRQMTDEELADIIELSDCENCPYWHNNCGARMCRDGFLKWLKQEVSEDETERTD